MFRILTLLFSLALGLGVNVSVTPNNHVSSTGTNTDAVVRPITVTPANETAGEKSTGEETEKNEKSDSVAKIAQCLSDQNAKLYGAFWCPHCQEQKKMFGDAIQQIQYYECDQSGENSQWQLCDDAEIQAYPTWIFGNGERVVGAYKPEDIGKKAGCII